MVDIFKYAKYRQTLALELSEGDSTSPLGLVNKVRSIYQSAYTNAIRNVVDDSADEDLVTNYIDWYAQYIANSLISFEQFTELLSQRRKPLFPEYAVPPATIDWQEYVQSTLDIETNTIATSLKRIPVSYGKRRQDSSNKHRKLLFP